MKDLDAQIAQLEQRILGRELALRESVQVFARRLHRATRPRQLLSPLLPLVPVLGGVLALLALGWWMRRPSSKALPAGHPPPPLSRNAAGAPPAANSASWVRLAGLLWPALPAAWRARVNPSLVTVVMGAGPLLLELLSAERTERPLRGVGRLDASLLAGDWEELAALPGPSLLPTPGLPPGQRELHLRPLDGGRFALREHQAGTARAGLRRGRAELRQAADGMRLRSSLWPAPWRWLPMAWREEVVMQADADALLLGSSDRSRLALLLRPGRPLPVQRIAAWFALARAEGFALEQLQLRRPA